MGKRESKPPKHLEEFHHEGAGPGGDDGEGKHCASSGTAVVSPQPPRQHERPAHPPGPPAHPAAGGRRRGKRGRQVYRLLRAADVAPALLGMDVFVLWPDDGIWYAAVVEKVRGLGSKARQAAPRRRARRGTHAQAAEAAHRPIRARQWQRCRARAHTAF